MSQGEVQASVRAATGTAGSWEGDWHALFTLSSIPLGTFDCRLLAYLNLKLGASYASLPGAQAAFALANGAANWSSLGPFTASPAPPVVLPSANTPTAVYMIRMPGYNGPSMTVTDASAVSHDIGWQGDNTPSASDIAALSFPVNVATVYDTTGNGLHMTQVTANNRPFVVAANAYKGKVCISFCPAWSPNDQWLNIPSLTLNRQTYAAFHVFFPIGCCRGTCFYGFLNTGALAESLNADVTMAQGVTSIASGTTTATNIVCRNQPSVLGMVSTVGGRLFYLREQVSPQAAATSLSLATGALGTNPALTGNIPINGDWFGGAFYSLASVTMSQAQGQAIYDALGAAYGVVTQAAATSRVIFDGDSLTFGQRAGTTLASMVRGVMPLLKGTPEVFNTGIVGQTLSTISSLIPTNAERLVTGFAGGPVVVYQNGGTNDYGVASSSAAAVAGFELTWVNKIKAANAAAKIVMADIGVRNDASWSVPKDTNAIATNTARQSFVSGANGYVAFRTIPHMQVDIDANDTTYFFTDKLHIIATGHALQVPNVAAALNAFL